MLLLFSSHTSPSWPDCWFATLQNIDGQGPKYYWIPASKSQKTQSHFTSVQQMFARKDERGAESPLHIMDGSFCRCRVPYDRVDVVQADHKATNISHTEHRQPTSSTLVQKWLVWAGQESLHWPSRPDINRQGARRVWCSGILAHSIHILSKLNKQAVPHTVPFQSSEHHCYLQLCPPLVSTREEKKKQSERGAPAVVEFKYGMLHTQSLNDLLVLFTTLLIVLLSSPFNK